MSNVSLVTGCNNTKVSRGMLCMLLFKVCINRDRLKKKTKEREGEIDKATER